MHGLLEKYFIDCDCNLQPRYLQPTCEVERHCLAELGPQAIVGLAEVVSRIFSGQREVEGHTSSKEGWAAPQGNVLVVKPIKDWG